MIIWFRITSRWLCYTAARYCDPAMVDNMPRRAERHAPCLQIVQKANQIPQRTAQPVELPDDKRITFREHLETLRQFRALDMRPRGLVGKDALAPRLLEGGKLQVGILVISRDPRVADVHEPTLSLIYGTSKPLI